MKDILVYLDGTASDEARIAQAETLAMQQDAHLTGILYNALPDLTVTSAPVYASEQMIMQLQEDAIASGDRAEEALKTRFERLGCPNDLRRIDVVSSQAGQTLASECRTADVIVGTRFYGHDLGEADVMETVLFDSGSACLLVPPEAKPRSFETVLIAWANTPPTARAIRAALPILSKAKNVVVAMVHRHEPPEFRDAAPGADIARYLDRHGISVEVQHLSGWSNPAEALLLETENRSADLIVMGGYGHSRFREWVMGGVTREVLTKAQVPVLLAH